MKIPEGFFEVEPEAEQYIYAAELDSERYIDYLLSREVPKAAIEQLRVRVIADSTMVHTFLSGFYAPPNRRNQYHAIGFVANNLPISHQQQAQILRHETEHLIEQIHNPNSTRQVIAAKLGAMVVGGALTGLSAFELASWTTEDWPILASLPLKGAMALTGGYAGLRTAHIGSLYLLAKLSPAEHRARRAETEQKETLPDGVVKIWVK